MRVFTNARWLLYAALAVLLCAVPALAGVHHELDVVLDPAARRVTVTDRVTVTPGSADALRLPAPMELAEATAGGRTLAVRRLPGGAVIPVPQGGGELRLRYTATLPPFAPDGRGAAAGEDGVYLPAGSWIASSDGEPPAWRLTVRVPAPYVAVATGALMEEQAEGGYRAVFAEARSVEEPSLFAGPWRIAERRHGDIRLRTYFHPEQEALSPAFLDDVAAAIDGFAARIGPYPFAGFAVVSAPLPVGLGFPALTYIGRRVLPLPFVRGQSLAHEVLHNWWGNGVRVAYEGGNWAEGLTTLMADHDGAAARDPSAARSMRLEWLRDYAALPADHDTPLTAFRTRTHAAGQIVGYGKAAYLFHMLRGEIGEAAFTDGLRRFWVREAFQDAGWPDLRHAFEEAAGRDLGRFFAQWLERPGAPTLRLERATTAGNAITLTLAQDDPTFTLSVPVSVRTSAGTEAHRVRLEGRTATVTLPAQARPLEVAIDPGLDLFRRLAPGEAPPILRDTLLDSAARLVIVAEGEAAETARALASRLLEGEPQPTPPDRLDPTAPLLLIGTDAAVAATARRLSLPPMPDALGGRGTARVWAARTADGRPVLTVAAADAGALGALLRPLPHYGRQSWLVFDGARAVERGVWEPTSTPLRRALD